MNWTRREFLQAGGAAMAVAAGAGCERAGEARAWLFGSTARPLAGTLTPPGSDTLDPAAHALHRLTFGPRPGDHARIARIGVPAFLEEQLDPETIADEACDRLIRRMEALDEPAGEMFEYKEKFLNEQLTRGTLLRAVASRRQLYEVMVEFWTDHFNIDPSKSECKWLKAADDREVVRRHAMGSFPAMLRASALSPAMLWYLDGRANERRKPEDRPNENYARELLELHTLGVHGGYTQQDVMEVARCLTGWTVRDRKKLRKAKVEFDPKRHDDGAKTVLGETIPAGLGATDLDRVLELVTRHPSTAQFIATKLCRRFIADEPPAAAIARTAQVFTQSAGDVRQTLRALFATEEFGNAAGRKLKRPFHFVVSALRATNAETDCGKPLIEALTRMGHAPFRYPTPDGYPGEAYHWTGTLLWRWNFAAALARNGMKGTRIQLKELSAALGGIGGVAATAYGRKPTATEQRACDVSGAGLALLLASPAFQRC